VEKEVKVWHPQYGEISVEKATELLKASKPPKKFKLRGKLNSDIGEEIISEFMDFVIEEGRKMPYCELEDMVENLIDSISRPKDNLTFHSLIRRFFTLGKIIDNGRWFDTIRRYQLFEKSMFSDKVNYLLVRECQVFTSLVVKDMTWEQILYDRSLRRMT